MTSDSITEQAVIEVRVALVDNAFAVNGFRRPHITISVEAAQALLALAHQAPATGDEAAEVEWGVLLGEDGSTDLYDTEDETRRAAATHGGIVVSRTVTPWREVSS